MSEIKDKILKRLELTDEDFFKILWGEVEDVKIVESIIEKQYNWSILKKAILQVDDRFFRVYYYSLATEFQENEFFNQYATEVEKKKLLYILGFQRRVNMYIVYFENSNGDKRQIGAAAQKNEANKFIVDFLDEKNYKSHYWRRWNTKDNIERIDVGSHTEFFEIHNV